MSTVILPERCYTMDVMYPLLVVGTAERHICIIDLLSPGTIARVGVPLSSSFSIWLISIWMTANYLPTQMANPKCRLFSWCGWFRGREHRRPCCYSVCHQPASGRPVILTIPFL